MDRQQKIEMAVETAKHAHLRDNICSRSVLVGLQAIMEIPDELITASLSLAGGTGAASGSCGAYCGGLLGVGLMFNAPLDDELENPALRSEGTKKFAEYRDSFLREYGTVLCPQLLEKLFGRTFIFTDPKQSEEFFEANSQDQKCVELVVAATRLAAEMILSE